MIIQMTNAQFAIWIAKQEAPQIQDEVAERIFKWLEKREKTSPQDPAVLVEYTPKGSTTIEELYKKYKLTEEENKELKEYREKIDKANKQYFNSTRPLK